MRILRRGSGIAPNIEQAEKIYVAFIEHIFDAVEGMWSKRMAGSRLPVNRISGQRPPVFFPGEDFDL